MVRAAGLEPARKKREILSLLCLPFHHARIKIFCLTISKSNADFSAYMYNNTTLCECQELFSLFEI